MKRSSSVGASSARGRPGHHSAPEVSLRRRAPAPGGWSAFGRPLDQAGRRDRPPAPAISTVTRQSSSLFNPFASALESCSKLPVNGAQAFVSSASADLLECARARPGSTIDQAPGASLSPTSPKSIWIGCRRSGRAPAREHLGRGCGRTRRRTPAAGARWGGVGVAHMERARCGRTVRRRRGGGRRRAARRGRGGSRQRALAQRLLHVARPGRGRRRPPPGPRSASAAVRVHERERRQAHDLRRPRSRECRRVGLPGPAEEPHPRPGAERALVDDLEERRRVVVAGERRRRRHRGELAASVSSAERQLSYGGRPRRRGRRCAR